MAAETSIPATLTPTTHGPPATVASSTSGVPGGPLEFSDGRFLGIRQGSLLADASAVLGVEPIRLSEADLTGADAGCTQTPDVWVIQNAGLTLYFEELDGINSTLTNWTYEGGPVAGFDELVAPHDIHIGDTRSDVTAAYTNFDDLHSVIDVYQPFPLRFALDGDTITWFGVIDCGD
jgi:hypothetical protein